VVHKGVPLDTKDNRFKKAIQTVDKALSKKGFQTI
jgi:hypothetical protein